MIQLGNPGNFVHAIWLDKIKEKISLDNRHFVGQDHLIVTGKNLQDDIGRIQSLNPDIIITGKHDCKVNCSECCDRPAYGNGLSRRYCEYLTEVGSYCMIKMLGQKADEVCENWFCQTYCDDSVNLYSGIPLEVPDINDNVERYHLEKKIELLRIIEAVRAGRCIEDMLGLSSRSQEVLMYKRAKSSLEMMARSRGNKDMLYHLLSDRFDDVEAQLGCNEHLDRLKAWSEIYRKRKLHK